MIQASILVWGENCLASAWFSQDSGVTPSLMDVWHGQVSLDISLTHSTFRCFSNLLDLVLVLKPSEQDTHRHLYPVNHGPKVSGPKFSSSTSVGQDAVVGGFVLQVALASMLATEWHVG